MKAFKMPGISQPCKHNIFESHQKLMNLGKTVIPQKRKINKLAGNQTTEVELKFCKK